MRKPISIMLVRAAMKDPLLECVKAIHSLLDRTPPEVRKAIYENGNFPHRWTCKYARPRNIYRADGWNQIKDSSGTGYLCGKWAEAYYYVKRFKKTYIFNDRR